jgi:hypothetical protein
MTTIAIRKKLHQYIDGAKDKNVKAIFSLVEDVLKDDQTVWTEEFKNEQDNRARDFEMGKVKGKSWSSVKKAARK